MDDAAAQGADLHVHRRAAVERSHGEIGAAGVLVQRLGDLHGQFARRHEHEPARGEALGALARQQFDHRQGEGRGLAGARAGHAEHVLAVEQHRDGFALDGGGLLVAERGHGGDEGIGQAEGGEAGGGFGGGIGTHRRIVTVQGKLGADVPARLTSSPGGCHPPPMAPLTDTVQALMAADPRVGGCAGCSSSSRRCTGAPCAHPARSRRALSPREVPLVDGVVTMPCVVETDTLLIALEDARIGAAGHRHRRRSETAPRVQGDRGAPRARQDARHTRSASTTDPLFGVIVVGGPRRRRAAPHDDPRRAAAHRARAGRGPVRELLGAARSRRVRGAQERLAAGRLDDAATATSRNATTRK